MPKHHDELRKWKSVYKHADLLILMPTDEDLTWLYYRNIEKPYRALSTTKDGIDFGRTLGFSRLNLLFGEPIGDNSPLEPRELQKVDELEHYFNWEYVNQKLPNLLKNLRQEILAAHEHGVLYRFCTEFLMLESDTQNQLLEHLEQYACDSLQLGYGLNRFTDTQIKALKMNMPKEMTLKIVGGIDSLDLAQEFLDAGADIIGTLGL